MLISSPEARRQPLSTGTATPQPTHPGMVSKCNEFVKVSSGDPCDAIAFWNGVAGTEWVVRWNTGVGPDCRTLPYQGIIDGKPNKTFIPHLQRSAKLSIESWSRLCPRSSRGSTSCFPAHSRAPDTTVHIGNVPYESRIKNRIEHWPVVVDLIAVSGHDLEPMPAVERIMALSGRPTVVKRGERRFHHFDRDAIP